MGRNLLTETPSYPWDGLRAVRERAASYPDGLVDLSIGSPVDAVPGFIRKALSDGSDTPGYTTAAGEPPLRAAMSAWLERRHGVSLSAKHFLPTIGLKEFIAQLPYWLGLGPGDVMVQPRLHYPTYEVGAQLVGAEVCSEDDPAQWPERTRLIWLNSPSNPDGRINDADFLRRAVARARALGAVLVQDECYSEFAWVEPWIGRPTPTVLDPAINGGRPHNLLAMFSLSKQSNLAGYRAGVVAGCGGLVSGLVNLRKQIGLAVPAPIQAAMVAALGDDRHVAQERERYRRRRELLLPALEAWGLRLAGSQGGLYLWGTRGEPAEQTLAALAELGILVAPGTFYGEAGAEYVRVSTTATDSDVERAARRLQHAA